MRLRTAIIRICLAAVIAASLLAAAGCSVNVNVDAGNLPYVGRSDDKGKISKAGAPSQLPPCSNRDDRDRPSPGKPYDPDDWD